MLLLALRQQKWSQAAKIAVELSEKTKKNWYRILSISSRKAFNKDSRASVLLKIWADLKWKKIKT